MKNFHEAHNELLREALQDVNMLEKQYIKDHDKNGEYKVRERWIRYRKEAKELREKYDSYDITADERLNR